MESIISIVHVVLAATIIGLVLLQQGKGANAGASFGGGASSTVFGAGGSGNFLTKSTSIVAALFFLTSLSLSALYSGVHKTNTIIEDDTQIEIQSEVDLNTPEDIPTLNQEDIDSLDENQDLGVEDLPDVNSDSDTTDSKNNP